MVVIRLARGGKKKRPFYTVVVADSREARDARFIEQVGHFNPVARGQEKRLVLKQERIDYWQSKGAQPSSRVKSLIIEHQRQPAKAEGAENKAAKPAKKAKAD